MDNPSPKTLFKQNQAINDSPLSDQQTDLYQDDEENGDEDFSGDESMHTAIIEGEEDEAMADESVVKVPVLQDQDGIPKVWKYVEVAGSFDELDAEGGGGFVIRDWEGKALLAQAFPGPGKSLLFMEAYAIHKAMEEIITLREDDVMFCLESEVLYDYIHRDSTVPGDILPMLRDCINWCKKHSFRVFLWKREELEAAWWLSIRGRLCQQYCQWDNAGPWPPVLDDLIKAKFNF